MQTRQFNLSINHQQFKKQELILLIISFIFFFTQLVPQLVFGILNDFSIEEYISGTITQLFWCATGFFVITHCLFLYSVQIWLEILNTALKNQHKTSEIVVLSTLNIELCELVDKLNKISSFQILSFFGLTIMNTTFGSFEIYDFIIHESNDKSRIFYSLGVVWFCCFFLIHIAMLISVSSRLMNQGYEMIETINLVLSKSCCTEAILRRFQVLLMQLDHLNLQVSCGFFVLDWKAFMMVRWLRGVAMGRWVRYLPGRQ